MKKYFSVGEAAQAAHMTSETLRYYDRIGLVKPSRKDEWTKYRYYTEQDIVRLNTVQALQQMDLPLQEIKRVLEYDDLQKVIDFLTQAERKADVKIAALEYSKSKIQLAKADFEKKLIGQKHAEEFIIKAYPARVIMLSDVMETPTLDTLWNYLSHFYEKIPPSVRNEFTFEDLAGIYTESGLSRMFAVCIRYAETDGLKTLPAGKYLCVNCGEENRERRINDLIRAAKDEYHVEPKFTLSLVVVSGILQWRYQVQVYLGS